MLTVPQYEVLTSHSPITIFFGGYGSGKTTVMGVLSFYFVSNAPNVVGMIAANTYGQLTRSTLFRIFQEWRKYGLVEYNEKTGKGHYVVGKRPPAHFKVFYQLDNYYNTISFINGALIFLASLDNYESLDGMEVGWMLLDETKDTKKDAMSILVGRLRQKGLYITKNKKTPIVGSKNPRKGAFEINPLYIFTAPSKAQWLYEFAKIDDIPHEEKLRIKEELMNPPYYSIRFIKNRKIVFAATHTNEKNLPTGYITNMQSTIPKHLQEMLIWGYPFGKEGGEFYKYFNEERHVAPTKYDPNLPLHLSFDENVMPYAPCGVWQVRGKHAYKIDEIDLEPPENNIFAVTKEILRRYGNHKAAVYIYGDATSQKRDAKLKAGENFFSIVKKQLAPLRPIMRVPKANPPVKLRGEFINAIHEKEIFDIRITIDPKCKNTINDYKFLKEAADGGKLKVTEKDPTTGVSYTKYSHDSDLDDYFICEYFKKEYQAFLKGGKLEYIDPLQVANENQFLI